MTAQIFVVVFLPSGGKEIEWDAWPFLLFYPLAIFISPLLGLLSVRKLPFCLMLPSIVYALQAILLQSCILYELLMLIYKYDDLPDT